MKSRKNNSTGPRTEAGKQNSKYNAVKHGLTGQMVVMPWEDRQAYDAHCAEYHQHFSPHGPLERHHVQTMADSVWRLNRLRAQEQNLLSFSGGELSECEGEQSRPENEQNEPTAAGLAAARAETLAFEKHLKDLALLSTYENRISRHLERAHKDLQALQTQHHLDRQDKMFKAACLKLEHETRQTHEPNPLPYDPQADGFDFSNRRIDYYVSVKNRWQEGIRLFKQAA